MSRRSCRAGVDPTDCPPRELLLNWKRHLQFVVLEVKSLDQRQNIRIRVDDDSDVRVADKCLRQWLSNCILYDLLLSRSSLVTVQIHELPVIKVVLRFQWVEKHEGKRYQQDLQRVLSLSQLRDGVFCDPPFWKDVSCERDLFMSDQQCGNGHYEKPNVLHLLAERYFGLVRLHGRVLAAEDQHDAGHGAGDGRWDDYSGR